MGSYVDKVNLPSFVVATPEDGIQETIDYTRDYADGMRDTLSDAIQGIQDSLDDYIPGDLPDSDIGEVGAPSFPASPSIDTDYKDFPESNIQSPNIREVDADFSFIEPTAPGEIDPSFDFTPGVYSSCVWDSLCERIQDDLLNGGNGLSDAVYGAIIDRNTEARRSAEDTIRRRATDAVGTKGFDLPGGMAAAVVLEVEKEILAKDIDAVNSTTIKDFEIADANTRFMKELSLKAEEMLRGDFASTEDRLFNIAAKTKELIVAIYEQNIRLYLGKWEGVKAKLEAAKAQVEAIISMNDSEIKVFLGLAEVYKAKIDAVSSENNSISDKNKAVADIYSTDVDAYSAEYAALIEEFKTKQESVKTDILAAVEMEKINLDVFTSSADLREKISESIANIAAQAIASALGAINTSMSFDYSGSTSMRGSASLDNSLTETHKYQES